MALKRDGNIAAGLMKIHSLAELSRYNPQQEKIISLERSLQKQTKNGQLNIGA